ncbi:hypothetical protein H6P81_006867 [Aristolochia fimbriata]|uniref:Uncharacterized protein n=1 Tax=Aristolochia fimbriata TaxID=158543 RepID=A0AAV7F323_ARIFI|nr:hypothetical protein H6P81_006867 [Aristolochia fimbriata]
MAAPSATLVGGLRAFDHTVVVEGETIQTLALYMEGDASHMTYLPERGIGFWGSRRKPTDSSRSSKSTESAPVVSAVEDSDEDYDSDRSHPPSPRPKGKGKRPVGASSASKKKGLSYHFGGALRFCVKRRRRHRKEVPPAFFPFATDAFLPPIPETEPPTSCPAWRTLLLRRFRFCLPLRRLVAPQEEASEWESLQRLHRPQGLPVQEVALLHQLFKKRRICHQQVAEMGHDVTPPSESTLSSYCTLQEIEPSAGEKVRRTSGDEAEGIARNTLP